MKILQVHNRYRQHLGGEAAVAAAEAAVLRSAGHEVVEYQESNPEETLPTVAQVLASPWNRRAAARLRAVVEAERPDVTHVHNTWYRLSPAVFPVIRQWSPVVMTLHNYRLVCPNAMLLREGRPCELCVETRNPWHAVRYRCYRNDPVLSAASAATIAFQRRRGTWDTDIDLLLALTEFARQRFVAGGLPEEKVAVKPNFVADPGGRAAAPSASDTVLFVGRLSHEKGADVLIDAWERARPSGLRLEIMGEGPEAERLAERPVSGIELLGPRPPAEVHERMKAARALVLPSIWYEGLSMVLLECLAAGLPVLASRLGAMPEVLEPLGPDWLVPPNDPEALARSLHLLEDDAAVDSASVLARARYEERYTPERGLADLEAVYARATRSWP